MSLSLTNTIAALATDTLTMSRRATGTRTRGRWVDGTATTFSAVAVVEPAGGRALKIAADSQRSDDVRVIYTATEVLVDDRTTIGGDTFEVFRVEPWTLDGETHYRAYLSRLTLP